MKDVISEAMERLRASAARVDVEEEGEEEEDEGKAQEDAELLAAVRDSVSAEENEVDKIEKIEEHFRIGDEYVIKFFRDKLHSKPCQNQGFIIDGFPKTTEQAEQLFKGVWYFCYFAICKCPYFFALPIEFHFICDILWCLINGYAL